VLSAPSPPATPEIHSIKRGFIFDQEMAKRSAPPKSSHSVRLA
jgi:hypothetical protein